MPPASFARAGVVIVVSAHSFSPQGLLQLLRALALFILPTLQVPFPFPASQVHATECASLVGGFFCLFFWMPRYFADWTRFATNTKCSFCRHQLSLSSTRTKRRHTHYRVAPLNGYSCYTREQKDWVVYCFSHWVRHNTSKSASTMPWACKRRTIRPRSDCAFFIVLKP